MSTFSERPDSEQAQRLFFANAHLPLGLVEAATLHGYWTMRDAEDRDVPAAAALWMKRHTDFYLGAILMELALHGRLHMDRDHAAGESRLLVRAETAVVVERALVLCPASCPLSGMLDRISARPTTARSPLLAGLYCLYPPDAAPRSRARSPLARQISTREIGGCVSYADGKPRPGCDSLADALNRAKPPGLPVAVRFRSAKSRWSLCVQRESTCGTRMDYTERQT